MPVLRVRGRVRAAAGSLVLPGTPGPGWVTGGFPGGLAPAGLLVVPPAAWPRLGHWCFPGRPRPAGAPAVPCTASARRDRPALPRRPRPAGAAPRGWDRWCCRRGSASCGAGGTQGRRRPGRGTGPLIVRGGRGRRLALGPIRGLGLCRRRLSRSDIGLVSGRRGLSQDPRSLWSRGAVRPSRRLVRHVIVVTSDDLPAELAGCRPELFWTASGLPHGAARAPCGGPGDRHKEFSEGGV